jgi:hypothetical protein
MFGTNPPVPPSIVACVLRVALPLVIVAWSVNGPCTVTVQLIAGTLTSKVQPFGTVTAADASVDDLPVTSRVIG